MTIDFYKMITAMLIALFLGFLFILFCVYKVDSNLSCYYFRDEVIKDLLVRCYSYYGL